MLYRLTPNPAPFTMKTQHAPGPLICQHLGSRNESIVFTSAEPRALVATVHGANHEADAVLFAAAPELLAALIAIEPEIHALSRTEALPSYARAIYATHWVAICQAIASATA